MAIELNFTETTARGAVTRREFIVTRDGLPVPGVLWESDSTAPGAPMVLFGHGASGDRHQAPIPRIAGALARRGIFGLAIDGPVHGLRKVGDGGDGCGGGGCGHGCGGCGEEGQGRGRGHAPAIGADRRGALAPVGSDDETAVAGVARNFVGAVRAVHAMHDPQSFAFQRKRLPLHPSVVVP